MQWLKDRKNFLVILGPPGTGKTWMCAAISYAAHRRFNTVRYWKEFDLLDKLRESIDKYNDYFKTLEQAMDDEFCIIDDIGSTGVTDWRKEVIFSAIDLRYNSMRPTIITSNLNRDQIKEKYEWRTADRLFAKENTIIDLFGMPSMRQEENDHRKTDTDQT